MHPIGQNRLLTSLDSKGEIVGTWLAQLVAYDSQSQFRWSSQSHEFNPYAGLYTGHRVYFETNKQKKNQKQTNKIKQRK